MGDDYSEQLEKAIFQYEAAFHLLNVTYPMINDPKLLLGVIDNAFKSMEASMDILLIKAKEEKNISGFGTTFLERMQCFRSNVVLKDFSLRNYLTTLLDLKDILDLHKKSPVEFQRGNKFVISGKDYRLRVISINDARRFVDEAQGFLREAQNKMKENEG